ncbi:MAG TPA: Wzz/FepE/Etk N-terminal domain-containing protein [Rhizomicrobium sp.]|jgi:hypothetical protein
MSDLLDDGASGGTLGQTLSLPRLLHDLRTHYLLLGIFAAASLGIAVTYVEVKEPVYTATAIVGPADKSDEPFGSGVGGELGGIGSIAKHLHAGGMLGQQGLDQSFDEYSALLTSNRLLNILVRKDNVLPELFAEDWDFPHGRWKIHTDLLHTAIAYLQHLLNRPVKTHPDQDDLQKYFEKNLVVVPSLDTSFATITLRFRSPVGAERLLQTILREADNIIRQDKRRDVAARIAYLNTALEHLTLADQKPELIDVLSEQEQEMMMIESDHLYASTLIDAPYAALKPTSPKPVIDFAIALALSVFAWLGVIRTVPSEGALARLLGLFARRKRRRPRGRTGASPAPAYHPLAGALRMPGGFEPGARLGPVDIAE